jgi:hypothetical protein
VFKQFINNDRVVVTMNPDYNWAPTPLGSGPAKLSQITFRILPDPSSQANALTTGEIQIAQNLNPGDVQSAVSAGKKKLTALSTGMPYCILANNAKPPTDELAVRQAIEFSVNTKAIIDTLFKGLYTPATSVRTPTTQGLQHDQVLCYSSTHRRAAHLPGRRGLDEVREHPSPQGPAAGAAVHQHRELRFRFGISQLMQASWPGVGFKPRSPTRPSRPWAPPTTRASTPGRLVLLRRGPVPVQLGVHRRKESRPGSTGRTTATRRWTRPSSGQLRPEHGVADPAVRGDYPDPGQVREPSSDLQPESIVVTQPNIASKINSPR